MGKTARDVLVLALIGLVVGLMLGVLAAGCYTTWRTGGDIADVGFGTLFEHAPWTVGRFEEPFRTGLIILVGVAAFFVVAVPAIGHKPKRTSHGSAEWAKPQELRKARLTARLEDLCGPIYGKLARPRSAGEFFTSHDIPHSLIAAPTGSGKGVGVVIPTLLTYKGSVFCLDVKGENFELTARRRVAMGDRVFKFSPYDPHGRTHRYNPLAYVADVHPRRRFTEARRLAASLIVARGNGQGFLEGAREIFAATALLAIERGTPRIGAVYDALAEPGEAFEVFQRLAWEVEAEEAKKIFNRMAGMESRILSSYLSVLADGGLGLWADPAVRDATDASDFGIDDLRRDPTSIFVIVSPNDIVPLAPLVRLMFQQTIALLQRAEPGPDEPYPVLFLLDEFASLGRMEVLQQAVTTLRGYGGCIMIVVQTLASIRDNALYGREGAAVFLANCRLQLFMSPADNDTPEYVSSAIGDFTRVAKSKSWRSNEFMSSFSEREEGTRLIRAAELRQLGTDKVVALVQNMKPVIAQRVTYYEDKELLPLFEGQTGRLPEPASLYPEDTNPFLAKRLTAEAEGEGETPTTGASEANWEEPNEPEVEGTDEVESADTDQIEKEDPASASNALDQVEEGEAEALEVLNEIQERQALILAKIPEARGRWRHGELDGAGRQPSVRPHFEVDDVAALPRQSRLRAAESDIRAAQARIRAQSGQG